MIIEFSKVSSLLIYIFLFFLVSFGISKFRNNKIICFLFLVPIVIIFGFRYCGTDIITYDQIITRYGSMDLASFITVDNIFNEIGFKLLSSFFYKIGGFSLVNIIIGVIILFPIYSVFLEKKNEYDIFLMSFIFLTVFFTISFNIMRQFMAVSLVTYAYNELKKKKILKYVLITICAISFHNTGLISAFFYVYNYAKNMHNFTSKKSILKLLIISFFGLMLGLYIFSYLSSEVYLSYLESEQFGSNRDFYVILLKFLILLALRKKLVIKDKNFNEYIIFLIVGLIIGLTGFYSFYIKRAYYYFNIYECMAFSLVPSIFVQKSIIRIFIFVFYVLLFILITIIIPQGNIIPFRLRF